MKKIGLFIAIFAVTLFIVSGISHSAENTIVGVWMIIDGGETKSERGQIEIYKKNGVYEGKIISLRGADPNVKCTSCTGEKKDQPLLGMVIMYDMKKKGKNKYGDGKFFDIGNGRESVCKLSLVNPDRLKVYLFENSKWISIYDWHRIQ